MFKVMKVKCIQDISFKGAGRCKENEYYYARPTGHFGFYVSTDKGMWGDMSNHRRGLGGPIVSIQFQSHFEYVEDSFFKNIKDLNRLIKPVSN